MNKGRYNYIRFTVSLDEELGKWLESKMSENKTFTDAVREVLTNAMDHENNYGSLKLTKEQCNKLTHFLDKYDILDVDDANIH